MVRFLKEFWFSMVAMGEKKLWFSGAVFIVVLCTIWLYSIFLSLINQPNTIYDEWGITLLLVAVVIPMLIGLLAGYIRKKFGFPSIEPDRMHNISYSDSRIVGLIWLANIGGVIFVIVLPKLAYDIFAKLIE